MLDKKCILTHMLFVAIIVMVASGCTKRYSKEVHVPYTKDVSSASSAKKHPTMRSYVINGVRYYPTVVDIGQTFRGVASWYGPNFHGKLTSNGETYNMYAMTSAHKTLPMNTVLEVTNLNNGRKVVVRINDRGPFVDDRIIDLSKEAAQRLDVVKKGTSPVRLEVLGFYNKSAVKDGKDVKRSNIKKTKSEVLTNFYVQVGSFKDYQKAKKYRDLQSKKTDIYPIKIVSKNINDTTYHRVIFKGFKSEREAQDFVRKKNLKDVFIAGD